MTDLSHLNDEQKQAVLFGEGPLLVVAGAGTGKTTVIVERIKHLILDGNIDPSNMLALTFTEKAATEMEERVDLALPYGYTQMWILTFHAFCDRILRTEGIHIGLNPSFKLSTEAEALLFLRNHLYDFALEYFRPLGNPHKFLSGMLTHFSRLKDDDITPSEYLAYAKKLEEENTTTPDEIQKTWELARAYETYEQIKEKEGVMDFSDLITQTLKLFRLRPHILKKYQDQFKHILVDEFQDTNFAQNELAMLLTGTTQNITVVGDDDQAIYRWRGAALANIIQFRDHFPKVTVITLNKNYRSTREVLTKSHQLIQFNNPARLEIQEHINKQLISMRDIEGDPVTFLFAQKVEEEAELVVQKINELVTKSAKGGKLEYKDIAILVRANDHSLPFVRALTYAGIPHQFLGPGQLFQQNEIKDVIAYLKVLKNFDDSASLYRVLTMAHFAISSRDIAAILNYSKKMNLSLFETLERIDELFISEQTKNLIKNLTKIITSHLALVPKETAGKILYQFFMDTDWIKKIINPQSDEEIKISQNIALLFDKLTSYESSHDDASIFAVTDWIDLSMELGESPLAASMDWGSVNAVNILTVHSSKGLEFPAVFITNLVTQRFPTRARSDSLPVPEELLKEKVFDTDPLAEERRLFYVAMTRAKDYLYLTASYFYGEGKRERKISPFVIETLGKNVVESIMKKKEEKEKVTQLNFLEQFSQPIKPALEEPKPYQTPVTYLSYSMIQTYDMCPLHYKLRYIFKIPTPPTAALSFGSSIHAVLQDYYQEFITQKLIPENLDSLLKAHWITEGYLGKKHEEQAYVHAEKLLRTYTEKHVKESSPIALETPFIFSLNGLKIGGRVDRIDKKPDGKIAIIDYKTGKNLPTQKEVDANLQLSIYALAATEVKDHIFGRNAEDITLELHYLDCDQILTTTRTQEQLESVKIELEQKAKEIEQSDYVCSVINCRSCEYQMLCSTYKS
jgi:DNA helicase-2/ATP-dependent DNA helicase PcrA